MMNLDEIKQIIPHREPFILLTRVLENEPGRHTVAEWELTGQEYFFQGHFPGYPVVPGVLIAESIAQTGAVAILSDERFRGKLAMFGGIDKVRFRQQVRPGDTLRLEITIDRVSHMAGRGRGTAMVNGKEACAAEILFVLQDRPAEA